MARGGVNKAVVQIARTAILARGEHPSIDAVRIEMGNTGSKTTIHRYLKELDESDSRRGVQHEELGDELSELVARLAQRLKEQAQEPIDRVEAHYEQLKAELRDQLAQAQQAHLQLQQQLDRDEAFAFSLDDVVELTPVAGVGFDERADDAFVLLGENKLVECLVVPVRGGDEVDVEVDPFLFDEREPADHGGCEDALLVGKVLFALSRVFEV